MNVMEKVMSKLTIVYTRIIWESRLKNTTILGTCWEFCIVKSFSRYDYLSILISNVTTNALWLASTYSRGLHWYPCYHLYIFAFRSNGSYKLYTQEEFVSNRYMFPIILSFFLGFSRHCCLFCRDYIFGIFIVCSVHCFNTIILHDEHNFECRDIGNTSA